MAASYGATLQFMKEQLQKAREQLYFEKNRQAHPDPLVINSIQENIANLTTEIEQYERRDFYQDVHNHKMPPPH